MSQDFTKSPAKLLIESVIPLSSQEIDAILDQLELPKDTIAVENIKTPSLIAGLRISFQGKVIDMSFQNQLNQLKE